MRIVFLLCVVMAFFLYACVPDLSVSELSNRSLDQNASVPLPPSFPEPDLNPCGDGVCDYFLNETDTTCPQDCPSCDDGTDCTLYYFDYYRQSCFSEEVVPCCGNGLCEENEATTCPVDCFSHLNGFTNIIPADIFLDSNGRLHLGLLTMNNQTLQLDYLEFDDEKGFREEFFVDTLLYPNNNWAETLKKPIPYYVTMTSLPLSTEDDMWITLRFTYHEADQGDSTKIGEKIDAGRFLLNTKNVDDIYRYASDLPCLYLDDCPHSERLVERDMVFCNTDGDCDSYCNQGGRCRSREPGYKRMLEETALHGVCSCWIKNSNCCGGPDVSNPPDWLNLTNGTG